MLWFGSLGLFVSSWFIHKGEWNSLLQEETALRSQLQQLGVYGKWTVLYVKVDRALEYLTRNKLTDEQKRLLTEQLWQISRSYDMDPMLILAVGAQESRGNPNARGRMQSGAFSGALGLMQIKLETAQALGSRFGISVETEEDLLRPEINVTVGTAYLIRLLAKYGNWKEALMAYNLGHTAVDRLLEKGEPLPTSYYEDVFSKYRKLLNISFVPPAK